MGKVDQASELKLSISCSDFIYALSFFNYKTRLPLVITTTPLSRQSRILNHKPQPSTTSTFIDLDLRSRSRCLQSRFPTSPNSPNTFQMNHQITSQELARPSLFNLPLHVLRCDLDMFSFYPWEGSYFFAFFFEYGG
jgi:hypothetical protein